MILIYQFTDVPQPFSLIEIPEKYFFQIKYFRVVKISTKKSFINIINQ